MKITEEERRYNIASNAFKCPICGGIYYKVRTHDNALAEKYAIKNEDGFHEMPCSEAGGECEIK